MKQRRPRIEWRAVALALAGRIPRTALHSKVVGAINLGAVPVDRPWAVALSGGADSVALLLLIWAHWPDRRDKILALHFDHALRGRHSRADAEFCRHLCRALGVRFRSGRWKRVPKQKVSESEARAARFHFFRREMARWDVSTLWLGHHQDDIAETMLMRLGRGSGLSGLIAPRPLQKVGDGWLHVRPLLTLQRQVLRTQLTESGAIWREDLSNLSGDFLRNRVRHNVMATWKATEPDRDVIACAASARELLEEDAEALDAWAERHSSFVHREVNLKELESLPKAIVRRVLHRWRLDLGDRCGELSRQAFERLLEAAIHGEETRMSMGDEGFAVIRQGILRFLPAVPKRRR